MIRFKIDLEAQVSHKGTYEVPTELNEAYILKRTGWTFAELRATPAHIVEKLSLLWHLENMQHEYSERQSKAGR